MSTGGPRETPNPTTIAGVVVRRSKRRKRTISWLIRDGSLLITMPATWSVEEERSWVEKIEQRVRNRIDRSRRLSDRDLDARCRALWVRFFSGECPLISVRWTDRQEHIHASCSTATAEIRISTRLSKYPDWVVDYILVHELAHLLEPSHNERFWNLVRRYPLAERARGFLEACDLGFTESDL